MNAKQESKERRSDPHGHWSYRMISALCGIVLGVCAGFTCVFLTGIDSFFVAGLVIGMSAVVAAIVAYRFPYAPDLLHFIADWMK